MTNTSNKTAKDGDARWVNEQSVGSRILKGLTEFAEVLESGQKIETRYTMRTVDLDLTPIAFSAKQIKALRAKLESSQSVFAALLGVETSTVQAWEQSKQSPGPTARRLLQFMAHDHKSWQDMLKSSLKEKTTNNSHDSKGAAC